MNEIRIRHIVAKTHTPEYLIHKYWSRKPHNILRELFGKLLGHRGAVFVDPFCGSGVSLVEAARLGAEVYGADLNPVAALMSKVSTDPPAPDTLEQTLEQVLEEFISAFGPRYALPGGKEVRYVVHATSVKCEGCDRVVTQEDSRKRGRTYECRRCGTRAHFNLENWVASKVIQVRAVSGEVFRLRDGRVGETECKQQERRGSLWGPAPKALKSKYDAKMLVNRRVLAFPGMTVSDLFTPRAFSAACWLSERVSKLEAGPIRDACFLFLTSCLAQFSRLIPYRNDLKTGGPAWTVPGFWVAPIHLETNPIVHLRARKDKFVNGMRLLHRAMASVKGSVSVKCQDAAELLQELKRKRVRADLIFLDPPYGDSVPYLEFSVMWNALLRHAVRYEQELVISDRTDRLSRWERYQKRLGEIIALGGAVLANGGTLLVTFNNLDPRTWYAMLKATRDTGLWCARVHYQVPPVVSAKAQFSPENSYVGDFYCVFSRQAPVSSKSRPHELIGKAVAKVIKSRRTPVAYALVQRAALLTILRGNLTPETVLELDKILTALTVRQNGGVQLHPAQAELAELKVPVLADVVRQVAAESLATGPLAWDEVFMRILDATEDLGVPSEREARSALTESVLFGELCSLVMGRSAQRGS